MMCLRTGSPALLALVVGAGGCGGGPGTGGASACLLSASDSVFLVSGPVYTACSVDERAKLVESSAREDFRPSVVPQSLPATVCFSAEVRLVVDSAGRVEPETVRLVRSSDPAYGQAVLAGVRSWRFEPARREGVPVRQIVQERRMAALRVAVLGEGRASAPPRC